MAAAGLWTTADDLGRWGIAVMSRIGGSGGGFNFSHGGRDEGFVAATVFYPEQDVGLAVLTNATNPVFIGEVRRAFAKEFVRP